MLARETVLKIMNVYKNAWEKRDPDLITTIFAKDGTFQERLHEKPFLGHKEIRKYWQDKVVGEQKDVKFKLKSVFIENDTAIAEFDAKFRDTKRNIGIHLKSVAIFEVKDGKAVQWREYWHSKHSK